MKNAPPQILEKWGHLKCPGGHFGVFPASWVHCAVQKPLRSVSGATQSWTPSWTSLGANLEPKRGRWKGRLLAKFVPGPPRRLRRCTWRPEPSQNTKMDPKWKPPTRKILAKWSLKPSSMKPRTSYLKWIFGIDFWHYLCCCNVSRNDYQCFQLIKHIQKSALLA
mgnify:CR=1 FL=1